MIRNDLVPRAIESAQCEVVLFLRRHRKTEEERTSFGGGAARRKVVRRMTTGNNDRAYGGEIHVAEERKKRGKRRDYRAEGA